VPIARISGLLIYFAHVPKCAGSAVERYLIQRFGPLAMRDPRFTLDGPRWSKSSPQHIDAQSLDRLFPEGFLDGGFAVVRHPVDRLRSLFLYQRDAEGTIPKDRTMWDWLDALPARMEAEPFYLDNHPRPMDALVPPDCTVFRLEDGLQAVVQWLDEVAGADDGPREIASVNAYVDKVERSGGTIGPAPVITADCLERISEIYAADFDRFGYAHAWPDVSDEALDWSSQAQAVAK